MKKWLLHRKKGILKILSFLVVCGILSSIVLWNQVTKADVFIKNEKGNFEARDHLTILEIVAQKGQQVLGYTMKGQEPITIADIQSYTGELDIADFEKATGYKLTGSPGHYQVESQHMDNAFIKDVLGDSMVQGSVVVNAVEAAEVTKDMVESADLVYINSANYHKNLLYYYDQLHNSGAMGIAKGDYGKNYAEMLEEHTASQKANSIKLIKDACGNKSNALNLKDYNFQILELPDYVKEHLEAYQTRISGMKKNALDSVTEDHLQPLEDVLKDVNQAEWLKARKSYRSKTLSARRINDNLRKLLKPILEASGLYQYLEVNYDAYLETTIVTRPKITINSKTLSKVDNDIQVKIINATNQKKQEESVDLLFELKKDVADLTGVDREKEIIPAIKRILYENNYVELVDDYAKVFVQSSFTFKSAKEDRDGLIAELKALMDQVNSDTTSRVIERLAVAAGGLVSEAGATGNESKKAYEEIQSKGEFYLSLLAKAGATDYKPYHYQLYMETLGNAGQGIYNGYGISEWNGFFVSCNNTKNTAGILKSCDITWDTAAAILVHGIGKSKGLMYDTVLLSDTSIDAGGTVNTNRQLGDYNDPDNEENTCNMYKMLMISRQLQGDYLIDKILPWIDEAGIYYDKGKDHPESQKTRSFNKTTFNPSGETDFTKFREPDVVGTVYTTGGNAGNSKNYVYRGIWSFTGGSFLWGENFLNTNGFLSDKTADNGNGLQNDNALTGAENIAVVNRSKGDVIRYIMGITLNYLDHKPYRMLEIMPTSYQKHKNASEFYGYEGAIHFLRDCMGVDVADVTAENYQEYFRLTSMSIREFNASTRDLGGEYDVIYIGKDEGYLVTSDRRSQLPATKKNDTKYIDASGKYHRTNFNDPYLDGKVYFAMGDLVAFSTSIELGGVPSDYKLIDGTIKNATQKVIYDYWMNLTGEAFGFSKQNGKTYVIDPTAVSVVEGRCAGNDLTQGKYDDLLDYVRAGYPVLFDDELFYCDDPNYVDHAKDYGGSKFGNQTINRGGKEDASLWTYVDRQSRMYHFIVEAKNMGADQMKDGSGYANLLHMSNIKSQKNPANMDYAYRFEGGISAAVKRNLRVAFQLVKSPTEYSSSKTKDGLGVTIRSTEAQYTNYYFELDITSEVPMDVVKSNYNFEIYMDTSGSGKFNEEMTRKLKPSAKYDATNMKVILSGKWQGTMEGFIPWKVEAYNKSNPNNRFSYTGFSAFERVKKEKKPVYVLSVNLGTNLNFLDYVKNYEKYIEEYELRVVEVTRSAFTNAWSSGCDENTVWDENNTRFRMNNFKNTAGCRVSANMKPEYYNDNPYFDMIVLGFGDSSGVTDDFRLAGFNNLKYYLDSGRSLLFTHDGTDRTGSMYTYTDLNGNYRNTGSNSRMTTILKHYLGMDLWGTTYGPSDGDDYQKYRVSARQFLSEQTRNYDENFRGMTEASLLRYSYFSGFKAPAGATFAGAQQQTLYFSMNRHQTQGIDGAITSGLRLMTSKKARKMNRGQITEYPFIIDDMLSVATTHSQYHSLNLDMEDLTVWYALSSDSTTTVEGQYFLGTDGDAENNYYIYSSGNFTYTGSGHTSGQTDGEKKLFINTVIFALKANFVPDVSFPDAISNASGANVIDHLDDYKEGMEIKFIPNHNGRPEEVQRVFSDCKVFIDVDGDKKYTPGVDFPLFGDGDNYLRDVTNGQPIDLSGPNLTNKVAHTFLIPQDVIDHISEYAAGRTSTPIDSIYQYPLVVQVTDNGEKDGNNKQTVSNSVIIAKTSLHNLK